MPQGVKELCQAYAQIIKECEDYFRPNEYWPDRVKPTEIITKDGSYTEYQVPTYIINASYPSEEEVTLELYRRNTGIKIKNLIPEERCSIKAAVKDLLQYTKDLPDGNHGVLITNHIHTCPIIVNKKNGVETYIILNNSSIDIKVKDLLQHQNQKSVLINKHAMQNADELCFSVGVILVTDFLLGVQNGKIDMDDLISQTADQQQIILPAQVRKNAQPGSTRATILPTEDVSSTATLETFSDFDMRYKDEVSGKEWNLRVYLESLHYGAKIHLQKLKDLSQQRPELRSLYEKLKLQVNDLDKKMEELTAVNKNSTLFSENIKSKPTFNSDRLKSKDNVRGGSFSKAERFNAI